MDTWNRLLHWDDICSVFGLWLLLLAVGSRLVSWSPSLRRWGVGFGVLAAFLYMAFGFREFGPSTEQDLLSLAVRSLIAGLLTGAAAWLVLGSVGYVLKYGIIDPMVMAVEHSKVQAQLAQNIAERAAREAENQRKAAEELEEAAARAAAEAEWIRNLPPPPTREQRIAAAKQRYDATLRILAGAGLDDIELRSARERAKQQYLRDLDEVMK